jgi:hypothetical protein
MHDICDESFAELAHRAARLGCYIAVDYPIRDGERGPYVLRNASWGEDDDYDAHVSGCDLALLEFTIRDPEIEEQMFC